MPPSVLSSMMTARSRGNQDWDPMREDFDNTSYDPQNPDDSNSGFVNLDHCRLYITNIPPGLSEDGLSTVFSHYGRLVETYINKNPEKRYGLVAFDTPGEAKSAMMKLNRTEPLKLNISIAHKSNAKSKRTDKYNSGYRSNNNSSGPRNRDDRSFRDETGSTGSRSNTSMRNMERRDQISNGNIFYQSDYKKIARRPDSIANGDNMEDVIDDEALGGLEPDVNLELEKLKLEHLKLQEAQVLCKHRMLLLKQAEKKSSASSRCVLPDGRVVVRNADKEEEGSFAAGAGDANRETCSESQMKSWGSDASSTASTCVLCSDDRSRRIVVDKRTSADKSDRYTDSRKDSRVESKTTSKTEGSKSDCRSKVKKSISETAKYGDFYSDSEEEVDETNRIIQLRNTDYADIVEDDLVIVVALAGYPKSKMRLRQMELFQRCISEVMDMQMKAGLLKNVPYFLDYYLHRGTIVCVCRDNETRNWMIRISPGLQERMFTNLILLKPKIKRLCLAYLKIPCSCWPATAQDAFKLLQYFNPTLRTDSWRVYSQKRIDDVEYTSFLIDRVSGEIIRGPTFKNVIDYEQMEFEVSGYTEIYYECLVSDDIKDELHSVSSRVKLLNELRSADATPRNISDCSLRKPPSADVTPTEEETKRHNEEELKDNCVVEFPGSKAQKDNVKINGEEANNNQDDVLAKLKDVDYRSEKDEMIIWSEEVNNNNKVRNVAQDEIDRPLTASESVAQESDKTESIVESCENLISRNSNVNIDSNRGIAYHRRTNYLHVEPELKIAITLDGYPQNKLEGTHIRRLKQLFKEYLHRDMKQQRFANLIIPKFQDIYLSNGAVIYICDSLETKDYLTEVLSKFVNSTGWKLTFKDIKQLVRFTRIVMRLPKEHAGVESAEIIAKLQEKYPGLKPDCWKFYSDVAGKQKRQFGVDPESLETIKSPDFDPEYEGQKLSFRIIDRQKRDSCFEDNNQDYDDETENKELKDKILKLLYVPVEADMSNSPLTRIRTNHYSDVVADDLKLYVGPTNYPESRVDENLFHVIKKTFENIVYKSFVDGDINELTMPKIHDIYLFDGVIFVICQNMASRCWIDEALTIASSKLQINLKSTEYRGAVGIISMVVKTYLDTEEVISILQSNNPRLRTKFWRIISTVRSKSKLDVVLQIDKLSAQVIRSPGFNMFVGDNSAQFQLGHLQSLLKPLGTIEKLSKKQERKLKKSNTIKEVEVKKSNNFTFEDLKTELKREFPDLKINDLKAVNSDKDVKNDDDIELINLKELSVHISDLDPKIIDDTKLSPIEQDEVCKMVVKIPVEVLPKEQEDLNLIFDLLEDNNPGLNTELWKVTNDFGNYGKGKFILSIDKQSASVIRSHKFSPVVVGHKLKFLL